MRSSAEDAYSMRSGAALYDKRGNDVRRREPEFAAADEADPAADLIEVILSWVPCASAYSVEGRPTSAPWDRMI
jgi:hypothetical protein